MTYGKRRVYHSRASRARGRNKAAGTLQRAWRNTKKGRKPSAVVRQTEANRKAIKNLKTSRELKCTSSVAAIAETNWSGCFIARPVPVDNYGLGMNSLSWQGNTTAHLPDTSPSSGISNPFYLPVWQQPVYIEQGDGENQRIGNEVKMHRMVCKLMITGGDSQENGGIFSKIVFPQKMHFFVLLDTAPPPENPTLNQAVPAYAVASIPGQTLTYNQNWGMPMQAYTTPGSYDPGLVPAFNTNLKSLVLSGSNPPGMHINSLTNVDLIHQSFWSRDNDGISKGDRFKLLKHRVFNFNQKPPASSNTADIFIDRTAKHTVEHTETIKIPYKFRFDSDTERLPGNQRIYLVFASDTPTIRNSGATQAENYIDSPTICTAVRTWFSDA